MPNRQARRALKYSDSSRIHTAVQEALAEYGAKLNATITAEDAAALADASEDATVDVLSMSYENTIMIIIMVLIALSVFFEQMKARSRIHCLQSST